MNIHPTKRIPLANLLIELLKVDSEQALELVDFLASADDQAEVEGGLNWRDRDGGLIPESAVEEVKVQELTPEQIQDYLTRWPESRDLVVCAPDLAQHALDLHAQLQQEREGREAVEQAASRLLGVSFSHSEVRLLLVMSSGHETEASRAIHARCDELAEAQTALRAVLQASPANPRGKGGTCDLLRPARPD